MRSEGKRGFFRTEKTFIEFYPAVRVCGAWGKIKNFVPLYIEFYASFKKCSGYSPDSPT